MFIQRIKPYHQWLRNAIPLKAQLGQIFSDNIRIQGPPKGPSLGPLHPVSTVKVRYRKGGKCKISRVLQSPVSSTHASLRWRPVINLSRLNTFLHVEKFKMKTPESIRTSLIPGEWVSSIGLSDTYLHIPIYPHSRKYLRFCHRSQVFQFSSLPFGLSTAPQVFTMIVKEVKLTALSRGLRLHQYLDNWLIKSQSREEALVNTQAVVDLTQDHQSGKIRTESHSGVFRSWVTNTTGIQPLSNPFKRDGSNQEFILHLKSKHVLTARCLMSLIGLLASTEKMVP